MSPQAKRRLLWIGVLAVLCGLVCAPYLADNQLHARFFRQILDYPLPPKTVVVAQYDAFGNLWIASNACHSLARLVMATELSDREFRQHYQKASFASLRADGDPEPPVLKIIATGTASFADYDETNPKQRRFYVLELRSSFYDERCLDMRCQ